MDSLTNLLKSGVKTIWCFAIAAVIFPFFVTSYFVVTVTRKLWLSFLTNRYSYLEFAKTNNIRSLVDTSRNPGVLHILIKVKGQCDLDVVKKNFQEYVIDRKDKLGATAFTRLQWNLISCWGHYAWLKRNNNFDINNHIIYSPNYRGYPVTEAVVCDHVSEIISKYMPADVPPWQVYVIPVSAPASANQQSTTSSSPEYLTVDYFYILVRMHHLILEEEKNLNICDILMLNDRRNLNLTTKKKYKSPFVNLVEKPQKIPKLFNCITSGICNRWNEFIYTYDPLESPDGEKMKIQGILQLLSVLCIITVTVVSDFHKGFHAVKSHPAFKLQYLKNLIKREVKRRNLSWNTIYKAIKISLDPLNIVTQNLLYLWRACFMLCIMWPYYVYREIEAIRTIAFTNECMYPNTVCGFLYQYVPLVFGSTIELFFILWTILRAPKLIYEELFEKNQSDDHQLQSLSLCGRKVISWSEAIECEMLQSVATANGVSNIDLLLSMTAASLREFFQKLGKNDETVPCSINISGRSLNDQYILGRKKYEEAASGFICIKLPLENSSGRQIQAIQESVARARERQIVSYLLTLAQLKYELLTHILPAIWMKILLNFLSRRFPVTLTEIDETNPSYKYMTLWGDEILDIIYFRPPQANIGLSLTIQKFNSCIRLGVMTDALIAPKHNYISSSWSDEVTKIKNTILHKK